MNGKEIFIIGIGPYSIVIAELAEVCGYIVKGYYHYNEDRNGESYYGKKIISSVPQLMNEELDGMCFALSMGDNNIRLELAKEIRNRGGEVPSIIHPSVEISNTASVDEGVILKRNVSIQADSKIGRDSIICDNTTICHHTKISEGSFIAGSCIVGAYTRILKKAFIGQGAIIPSGKVKLVGSNSMVGAGSVVIRDVLENEVVAGNPAKHLKFNT